MLKRKEDDYMESVPTLLEIAITNRLRVFFLIYIVLSSLEMLVYKFFLSILKKRKLFVGPIGC